MQVQGALQVGMLKLLTTSEPGFPTALLTPGRILEAVVQEATADRAVLLLPQGLKLEVSLRTRLQAGERIRLQVAPEADKALAEGGSIILKLLDASEPAEAGRGAPQPSVVWLSIPLRDHQQGWAQLALRTEPESGHPSEGAEPVQTIHLWWETPSLGEVGVTLRRTGPALSVGFQVRMPHSMERLAAALPQLEAGLKAAGFPNPTLSCRPLREGEAAGPVQARGLALDRRL